MWKQHFFRHAENLNFLNIFLCFLGQRIIYWSHNIALVIPLTIFHVCLFLSVLGLFLLVHIPACLTVQYFPVCKVSHRAGLLLFFLFFFFCFNVIGFGFFLSFLPPTCEPPEIQPYKTKLKTS